MIITDDLKNLEQFWERVAGYERNDFDEICKEFFEFAFLEEASWTEIQSLLNLDVGTEKESNKLAWFVKHTSIVLKYYSELPRAEKDIWAQERFQQFKVWVDYQVEMLLNKHVGAETSIKLTVPQIALILAYKGIDVNVENSNELIKKYGQQYSVGSNFTSGDHLYNEYKRFMTTAKRSSAPPRR